MIKNERGITLLIKNERGITLFSLTVAIIIMIILAGVAIYGGLYENGGLINMVKDETYKQQNLVQGEEEKMNTVLQDLEEDWGISNNA